MTNLPEGRASGTPEPSGASGVSGSSDTSGTSGELRASDQDRDRVAETLREAAGEGRLSLDELGERLDSAFAAKTYAELALVIRDLPVGTDSARPVEPTGADPRIGGEPTSRFAVGILGGFQRKGAWVVPGRFTTTAFCGGGELDLREARFAERDVTIRTFAVMGGVNVVVPDDVEVIVKGFGIMGGFSHGASRAAAPGAPRVIVTGFAFWGGVNVEQKPTRSELKRLKAERKHQKIERKRQANELE